MKRGDLYPNTFQVPNVIADRWLALLTGNQIKIVLYIARHTYGWNKTEDRLSIKQFVSGITKKDGTILDLGVGMLERAVQSTLSELHALGVLNKVEQKAPDGGFWPSLYSLNKEWEPDEEALITARLERNKVRKRQSAKAAVG